MCNKFKGIDIRNLTYYFFVILSILIKKIKIDENWYKDIVVFYNEYATIKDSTYLKVNSKNPLYLFISIGNGYFEEIDENKYLVLVFTKGSKEIMKKISRTVE